MGPENHNCAVNETLHSCTVLDSEGGGQESLADLQNVGLFHQNLSVSVLLSAVQFRQQKHFGCG